MQAHVRHGVKPIAPQPAQPIQVKPAPSAGIDARPANEQTGRYLGEVRTIDAEHVYHDVGRGDLVKHRLAALTIKPAVGDKVRIEYRSGTASMEYIGNARTRSGIKL